MRIIAVYYVTQKEYRHFHDLSFVSFFNRNSVHELLNEFVLAAAKSLCQGRKVFEHDDVILACHRVGEAVAVLVTDLEYPSRISFELLRRVHEDSSDAHLSQVVQQCQDPGTVDALIRVQQQLDETLVVMHENMNKILARGDSIDLLVEKSENLSQQSKMFYKVARKHNRCCHIQ
jgi:synaptobrevin family protein YKT6